MLCQYIYTTHEKGSAHLKDQLQLFEKIGKSQIIFAVVYVSSRFYKGHYRTFKLFNCGHVSVSGDWSFALGGNSRAALSIAGKADVGVAVPSARGVGKDRCWSVSLTLGLLPLSLCL